MATKHCTVEYREVPGFPGYRVGDDGSVWSQWQQGRGGFPRGRILGSTWKRLKTTRNAAGYPVVSLLKRTAYVHVLILNAFVGHKPKGMMCRHLNGISNDNRLLNLRWGTQAENMDDSKRHGTLYYFDIKYGEECHFSKLTEVDVRKICCMILTGSCQRLVAKLFGVSEGSISLIKRGCSWSWLFSEEQLVCLKNYKKGDQNETIDRCLASLGAGAIDDAARR